jgi:predicted amidohydrolase
MTSAQISNAYLMRLRRATDVHCGVIGLVIGTVFCGHGFSASPTDSLPRTVKVAAVQISGYDKAELPRENYQPAGGFVEYIDRAGKDGVELIVFPEYVLGHIRVPGTQTQLISSAAKRNGIYVVVGCWEMLENGDYANSAILFGRDGKVQGRYRKTHAAVDTYEGSPAYSKPPQNKTREWFLQNDPEWKMQKGKGLPVFELDFGKVGIMTCYDGWFPEPPRVLSLKGAEVLIWINGRRGKVEDYICKAIMFQSHVAMIVTNQAYGSGTMIANSANRILAESPDSSESYITGTIDLHNVRQRRANSRNFQQRRPELYRPLTLPLSSE